jgi:acyl-CoA thioester hydrolase
VTIVHEAYPVSGSEHHPIFETTFHVRYAETDAMGIVHHSVYAVWFEEGRSALMRARGTSYTAFEADGVALAVSQLQIRYLSPARYDQLVTVRCWIDQIQSRKIDFAYEVIDTAAGKILVVGKTEHICITAEGKVARIPPKWRTLLDGPESARSDV